LTLRVPTPLPSSTVAICSKACLKVDPSAMCGAEFTTYVSSSFLLAYQSFQRVVS